MAAAVATPLERSFGRIAGITEMTSQSNLGSTNVTMQFDLSRDIDGAARDVEAAINAARGNLPSDLPKQSQLQESEPGRLADHDHRADLGQLHEGADVRCSLNRPCAEAGAV